MHDCQRDAVDFEAIARRVVELTDLQLIRQQLVLIWNQRGAIDVAEVEAELMSSMGASASGPYIKRLTRALRGLDCEP